MMTRRENYTRILKKEKGERLPFALNIDHWLAVNRANNTLPEEYRDMSRNDIIRAVGGTIWARTSTIRQEFDDQVKVTCKETKNCLITDYKTPIGAVQIVQRYAEDLSRALFVTEHWIKRVEDIKVVKFIAEHTHYSLDSEQFLQSEKEVGEDGVSLTGLPFCLPYIQFGKNDTGWEKGIYFFADYPREVEDLMEVYTQKNLEAASLIASGPELVVNHGDNMDEWTTPPGIFKKYAIPYYRKIAEVLHRGGKIFEVHWCGRTEHLLQFVPECDIDVVEAVLVKPMSTLTIPEALDRVGDNVVIQGGIPSVLLCEQGGSRKDLENYVRDLLSRVPHGYRFVMGMSDNTPPDADFERVKMTAEIVADGGEGEMRCDE